MTDRITQNTLIFDFMGCVHSKHDDIDKWEMGELKYHEDWNLLIPVVIKCHSLGIEKQKIFEDDLGLDDPAGWRAWSYRHIKLTTNIDYVYKCVIDFISFYNSSL